MLYFADSVASTNAALPPGAPHGYAVAAREQTAGRGQRGNQWEASPGQNVTMSIMLRPQNLAARDQFLVSEAVALGVADVVKQLTPIPAKVTIKWPNDIYVDDKKIAGILIENAVSSGLIKSSVAGIGLNINQHLFLSDAPNPVSIFQLSGKVHDTQTVAQMVLDSVLARMKSLGSLHQEYFFNLYRNNGMYPYRDTATGQQFLGFITAVDSDGCLTLTLPTGAKRRYYFKEVAFIH